MSAALASFLALALLLAPAPAKAREADRSTVVKLVAERTNAFRAEQGRKPVAQNEALSRAASRFAEWLAQHDRLGHEADGTTPSQRAEAEGYAYCIVTENLAFQYSSAGFTSEALAQALVEGWKRSPQHRQNLVDADVTDLGLGVAKSAKSDRWYAVQVFGLPASAKRSFDVTNQTGDTVRYRVDDRTFTLEPRVTRTHQRCRDGELRLATDDARTVIPQRGDRYAVVRDAAGLRLERR